VIHDMKGDDKFGKPWHPSCWSCRPSAR
jgi:hypothetical protein